MWTIFRLRFGTTCVFIGLVVAVSPTTASAAAPMQIHEFALPSGNSPTWLTEGLDLAIWFSNPFAHNIGRLTPDGEVSFVAIPNVTVGGAEPQGITLGPDGNVWFADFKCAVGRVTVTGSASEFPESPCGTPLAIAAGPDGALWFTDTTDDLVGRVTTEGVITSFAVPTAGAQPAGIAAGPDNNLWVAEEDGNAVARISPLGVITEFALPRARSFPYGITSAADGALWFTELGPDSGGTFYLGRITIDGAVSEFPLPHRSDLITSLRSSIWLTEYSGNAIARFGVRSHKVTELPLPEPGSAPLGIAPGPGAHDRQQIWFAEFGGDRVGTISR